MSKEYWITDMGDSLDLFNGQGEKVGKLERYAVWAISVRQKPEVVEVSNDEQYLKERI